MWAAKNPEPKASPAPVLSTTLLRVCIGQYQYSLPSYPHDPRLPSVIPITFAPAAASFSKRNSSSSSSASVGLGVDCSKSSTASSLLSRRRSTDRSVPKMYWASSLILCWPGLRASLLPNFSVAERMVAKFFFQSPFKALTKNHCAPCNFSSTTARRSLASRL